jgi:hypothetical protein
MSDNKALNDAAWRNLAQKNKIKDNGLQKALATYADLKEEDYEQRLKCVASISQLATNLKKVKEVAAIDDVVEYLEDVASAAADEKADVTKEATAAAKAETEAKKKADAAAKKEAEEEDDEENEEEDETADSITKLKNAIKSLRVAKAPYFFLVCDVKPYGLVISKKDIRKNSQAKKVLAQLAGGSTRPPKFGECRFDSNKLVFEMEKPPSGLARILQKWIKENTGLGIKVMVGTESAEEEEEPGADSAQATPKPPPPALAKAPEAWHKTRKDIENVLKQLKDAVRKEFADQGKDLIADIEKNMAKVDAVLDKLDTRLAVSLDKARAEQDAAARATELKNSKSVLIDYIKYVTSDPLIAHIDSNPFGVKTNLKKTLSDSLTQMSHAIG